MKNEKKGRLGQSLTHYVNWIIIVSLGYLVLGLFVFVEAVK